MDSNRKFVIAAWIFVGCMVLVIISIPLYMNPPQPSAPEVIGKTTDPRIAGLVSTRVLSENEVDTLTESKTPQALHYEHEVIVSRVIENEVHWVAATMTPHAVSIDTQMTVEIGGNTESKMTSVNSIGAVTPIANNLQIYSSIPTPISPIPTPISPLSTPEPPIPQNSGDIFTFVQSVVDAQNAYYSVHGVYAQVVFGSTPVCPVRDDCINLDYPAGIIAAVNVYESPAGDGYEIVIINDGWRMVVNHGPESYRSTGWRRDEP